MKADQPDNSSVDLNRWMQRLIGLMVFAASASLLVCLSLVYRMQYDALVAIHVQGLALMVLVAFGLAASAAPFFAESLTISSKDKPTGHLEAIKLYIGVTTITFVALSFVFFVLWIVGWMMEFSKLGLALLKQWLIGPV